MLQRGPARLLLLPKLGWDQAPAAAEQVLRGPGELGLPVCRRRAQGPAVPPVGAVAGARCTTLRTRMSYGRWTRASSP